MTMADIFDEILGSELSLLFFVSVAVWILIFLYLYYTNNKLKRLEKEMNSLR
ncbi:MAG: CcmD family protein [Candidatus Heimdallarchaeota archaeon]|nr:MAG: CcmD family protein [Candidatus Heimdallarchaeota archaeon]